ncbi:hypothetical protein NHH82_31830 [Oxalobacteraceae bacterium OTU3REALA1]|nr:hypothetical protein NHH82_31830 [Oxalobacteraceae bacterium OTU3REALA1]
MGAEDRPVGYAWLIREFGLSTFPFEDGNGRIHRFLIHDFLGRDGFVPAGMVLPISAYMLHHPEEYDQVLESYSKPLRTVVSISIDDDEQLTINNPVDASGCVSLPRPDQSGPLFPERGRTDHQNRARDGNLVHPRL